MGFYGRQSRHKPAAQVVSFYEKVTTAAQIHLMSVYTPYTPAAVNSSPKLLTIQRHRSQEPLSNGNKTVSGNVGLGNGTGCGPRNGTFTAQLQ
jgi:hypothetical protein